MHKRTVVITGGTAGVGRAVAREFARRGWHVAVLARGEDRLQATLEELRSMGVAALALRADVADADAVFSAAARVAQEWGKVDVWVNCAMATVYGRVRELAPEEYRRVTEVTYLGYVHGTLAALAEMRPRNHGTIVQVGSALAYRAIPLQSAYCAAKFAARAFTDSLRSELIAEGSAIRLTMVQLPAVNTPQFDWARNYTACRPQPVPPIFQPEPIARGIVHAAFRAPRELWIGGPTVQAILGNMAAPGLLDRLLATRAIRGQLSNERVRADAPDNLFAPVPGDWSAHGRFDARASRKAVAMTPSWLRVAATAGFAALALAAARSVRAHATPSRSSP